MKKKVLGLLFAGIMMTGLTACKEAETPKYAVIENTTSVEDELCTKSVWAGVLQFATEHGETATIYTLEGDKRKDYAKAIDTAIEEGAEVIVCVGNEAEVAVYEAQNDYTRVKFVLLNGTPHKRFATKEHISDNTIVLQFDSVTDSYLAGYMAVASGARNIGCMSGEQNDKNTISVSGFIQGADAAAADLGLGAGDVQVRYVFTGEDKLSPAYMGKALEWYTAGCEVIFAPNTQVRQAVLQAAENAQRKVIGIGASSMNESDAMLTAAYTNYGGAVYQQLGLIKNGLFEGSKNLMCGISDNGYAAVTEGTVLDAACVAQYQAAVQKLSSGSLKINQEVKIPEVTLVTVAEDGQAEESVQPTEEVQTTEEPTEESSAENE